MTDDTLYAGYYYRKNGQYIDLQTRDQFSPASESGHRQEVEGAQVGSQFAPRNRTALRRVTGGFPVGASMATSPSQAPAGGLRDHDHFRPAQYNQNWNGQLTSDTWQEFHYPNVYRPIISNNRALSVMLGRTGIYANARMDRAPIAIQQYALNTRAVSPGTYSARVPRGGG